MSTPRGISVHIGVNVVDPVHYQGWSGPLSSCENDADTMQEIATGQGFETRQLKTTQATREAVSQAIKDAAEELADGDFFLVTYSGHGGQITDIDGDEEDGKDDTWCLYNGQFLDDEINVLFAEFKKGVRVLMLSDSCHSGTMLRGVVAAPERTVSAEEEEYIHSRLMPRQASLKVSRKHRSFYADIQRNLPNPRPILNATRRLLSGCQEDQESFGSKLTGRFTAAVKKVFAQGAFDGNYAQFHQALVEEVSKAKNPQTPNHVVEGDTIEAFDKGPPFKI